MTDRAGREIRSAGQEIRQLARYEVRPESLDECLAAISEFVAHVRANEPGTLRYDVWQDKDDPTRFVHVFVFRDAAAHTIHSESAEVKRFAEHPLPELPGSRRVHRLPAGRLECRLTAASGSA